MADAVSQLCLCVARDRSTLLDSGFLQYKGCKSLTDFTSFSPISLPLFQVRRVSVLCQPGMPSNVQISAAVGLWLRRRGRPFRFRRCF